MHTPSHTHIPFLATVPSGCKAPSALPLSWSPVHLLAWGQALIPAVQVPSCEVWLDTACLFLVVLGNSIQPYIEPQGHKMVLKQASWGRLGLSQLLWAASLPCPLPGVSSLDPAPRFLLVSRRGVGVWTILPVRISLDLNGTQHSQLSRL